MLNIKKLDVHYGPLAALQEISLEIKKGEIVTLLGPNGAGKTTLLLTISGILKTTEGRILFEEKDVTNLDPHKIVSLGIGHVPQGRHTFPTLSVVDNLLMGAFIHRKEKVEIKKDLDWIYDLFPILKERESQRAGTLSGGEQQMLTIGRAIMGRPRLLMLDEPSMGLASHLKMEIFSTFQRDESERAHPLHCGAGDRSLPVHLPSGLSSEKWPADQRGSRFPPPREQGSKNPLPW